MNQEGRSDMSLVKLSTPNDDDENRLRRLKVYRYASVDVPVEYERENSHQIESSRGLNAERESIDCT